MSRVKALVLGALILLMIGYINLYQSLYWKAIPCVAQRNELEMQPMQIDSPIIKIFPKDVSPLGFSHEILRRRSLRLLKEMRYTLKSKLKTFTANGQPSDVDDGNKLLEDISEMANYLEVNLEGLGLVDGAGEAQRTALQLLSETFTESIRSNQEPLDCQKARYLLVDINKACGFGCQIHHVVNCFFIAYGSNRVLQLSSNHWTYSTGGFSSVFQPLSRCQLDASHGKPVEWNNPNAESAKLLHCPVVEQMHKKPPSAPTAVPASIAAELHRLHAAPHVWVVGHFLAYLMRLRPGEILQMVNKELAAVDSNVGPNPYPFVGLHVRRTDKVNTEAAFHSLDEYMFYAKEYFDKLDVKRLMGARNHEWTGDDTVQKSLQTPPRRRIFIATDDPSVFIEARNSYPDYEFIGDSKRAQSASINSRYSHTSLLGVITDVVTLSYSNFIVCTFSSQICRLSYELMQTRALKLGDASSLVQSLDDVYYYGGAQYWQVETLIADKKVNLKAGDLVDYLGNHWNGEAKISHQGNTYLVPAYKFEYRLQSIPYGPTNLFVADDTKNNEKRVISTSKD